jgi:anti-anti-sigma factor
MQIFAVRAERDNGHTCIHASGELDLATAPCLQACAHEYIRGDTTTVEVDMQQVEFIDATGVRLLLTLEAQAQRDGWALTILPSDAVRRIVSLLGLQRRLLAPQLRAVEQTSLSAAAG